MLYFNKVFLMDTFVQPSWSSALRTVKFPLRGRGGSGRAWRGCRCNSLFAEGLWPSHPPTAECPQGREDKNLWDLPSSMSAIKDSFLLVSNLLSGNYVPILLWFPSRQRYWHLSHFSCCFQPFICQVDQSPIRNEIAGTLRPLLYESFGRSPDKGKPAELRAK